MKDDKITKIANNKKLLFIIPNFLYLNILLNYYNVNFDENLNVLYSEVILVALSLFAVGLIFYFIIKIFLKDKQKLFLIMCFISVFLAYKFKLSLFIMFMLYLIFLVFILKKINKCKLDKLVFILIFIISILFTYNLSISIYNLSNMMLNTKKYDYKYKINVEKDTKTPNIYYIHCDGMMAYNEVLKYFNYKNDKLDNYFKENNYYFNKDGSLVAGHRTQRALAAMFNPKYYDEFLKDYLFELEDTFLEKKDNTSYIVDFYELEEKRFNNELFNALKNKNYTLVGIGEYTSHTSLDVDYYFDYYDYISNYYGQYTSLENNKLRLIKNEDNSIFKRKIYARFTHSKNLYNQTMLHDIINNSVPIKHEIIKYQNFDTSKYKNIDSVYQNYNYWLPKAILKGINYSKDLPNNKFVFIDFNLNHDPYLFDHTGNLLPKGNNKEIYKYLGNYIYSSILLTEMLDFIHETDKDAIIIVQGDHGIHTVENEQMTKYFKTNNEENQKIRNSVISAYYIPEEYKNGDEKYLNNPLNISRYIVNNFVGENYDYIK